MNHSRVLDVLDALYRFGGQANQEISATFGLAPSTVTALVRELTDRGVIESLPSEHYPSARKGEKGRSKSLLRPAADYGTILAVDVTPTAVDVSHVDFALGVGSHRTIYRSGDGDERELDGPTLVQLVTDAARSIGGGRLVGVGVAATGTVDPRAETVSSSIHTPRLVDYPFVHAIRCELEVPVALVNDAHAIALGHRYRGRGRRCEDFIVLYIADGVGAGIFADGRLYRGWDNRAGELGSMVIDPNGDIGVSGRRGCFEDAVSRVALHRRLRDLALRGVQSAVFADERFGDSGETYAVLRDYFRDHDSLVRTLIDEVATRIGLVVANVTAAFSPELLLLSGPLTALGEEFLALVRHAFARFAVGPRGPNGEERVCLGGAGVDMKAVGCAKAAIDCHVREL